MLVFKGLFWLTIRSTTVPVSRGGENNLLASLTTSYLPPTSRDSPSSRDSPLLLSCHCSGRPSARRRRAESLANCRFSRHSLPVRWLYCWFWFATGYRGVPLTFLILIVVASVVHVITRRTLFGRYLLAVGGNTQAAFLCGIRVIPVVVASFGILGGIIALTGFMQTSYAGASTSGVGDLMELDAIAACVIGGTSLKGGQGTVVGTLIGATLMSLLLNGMTLLAVDPEIKFVVRGAVLVVAVLMDVSTRRQR